jgi:hypothetical protein
MKCIPRPSIGGGGLRQAKERKGPIARPLRMKVRGLNSFPSPKPGRTSRFCDSLCQLSLTHPLQRLRLSDNANMPQTPFPPSFDAAAVRQRLTPSGSPAPRSLAGPTEKEDTSEAGLKQEMFGLSHPLLEFEQLPSWMKYVRFICLLSDRAVADRVPEVARGGDDAGARTRPAGGGPLSSCSPGEWLTIPSRGAFPGSSSRSTPSSDTVGNSGLWRAAAGPSSAVRPD